MLTKQRKIILAMVLTVALAISMAPTTAQAGGGERKPKKPPTTNTPVTNGGKIILKLSGTALRGGSPGHSVSKEVSVPAPCWMEPSFTGKSYYEFVTGTGAYVGKGMANVNRNMDESLTAQAGYEKYKDDTSGHWWGGTCTSGNYDGPTKEFIKFAAKVLRRSPVLFHPGRPTRPGATGTAGATA